MTSTHASRTWKGCAMCKPWKRKGSSQRKFTLNAQRKLGQRRRLNNKRYSEND